MALIQSKCLQVELIYFLINAKQPPKIILFDCSKVRVSTTVIKLCLQILKTHAYMNRIEVGLILRYMDEEPSRLACKFHSGTLKK